jgi:polyribonucleotide nucleotidyltransferase
MASTCGSTLSLMDAGVPITSPVSGIAMGVIIESPKKYAILTDIIGLEDFNGDMDFKIAGTTKGVTAMQLDVKTLGLTPSILEEALNQSKEGKSEILKFMLSLIDKPRAQLSVYAPKIKVVKIPVEKIGELIGPGGRNIKKIIAETGAQVEVEEDGSVSITGLTDQSLADAIFRVEAITKEPKAGEIYEGIVKRIQPFGIFVEILPGKEGMVHVSDMSTNFVKDPAELVKMGDKVSVRVKEIDDFGRTNLSMILDPSQEKSKEGRDRPPQRFHSRRPEGGMGRGPRDDNRRRGGQSSGGGPHFPTSRFVDDSRTKFRR